MDQGVRGACEYPAAPLQMRGRERSNCKGRKERGREGGRGGHTSRLEGLLKLRASCATGCSMKRSVAVQAPRAVLNRSSAGGREVRRAAALRRSPAARAAQPGRTLLDAVKVCHRTWGRKGGR